VITATDPDGTIPDLSSGVLPPNANLQDVGNGTARFDFHPNYDQAGQYDVWFFAIDALDPQLRDSANVAITVSNVNRPPVFLSPFSDTEIVEDERLDLLVRAVDPDGETIILRPLLSIKGANFNDSGNGTGYFSYSTSYRDVDSTYLIGLCGNRWGGARGAR